MTARSTIAAAPRIRGVLRAVAVALVIAIVVTGASTFRVPGAAAAPDRAAAAAAARWLADQLVNGTYANPLASYPDYGLMIDAVFAMHAAGQPMLAEPILQVLDQGGRAIDYLSYSAWLPGGEVDRIGGATAKTLVAALVSRRDPRHFGGLDLVAETQRVLTPDGPERGRVRDAGPHIGINNANTFGQVLAVIGLAGVDASDPWAVDMLLHQQCQEGYFRIFYSYGPDDLPDDCDEGKATGHSSPDGDTTGFALSGLLAARRDGVPGLDGPITRAVAWLVAHQDAGGGWGGGVGTETPNTNSTGLVVQALADAGGSPAAVARGVEFLRRAQVSPSADAGNDLRGHVGAVAYTPTEYLAARSGGIGVLDTWIRASAQAALGLAQVGFTDLVEGRVPATPPPPRQPPDTTAPPDTTTRPTTAGKPTEASARARTVPASADRTVPSAASPGAAPAASPATATDSRSRDAGAGHHPTGGTPPRAEVLGSVTEPDPPWQLPWAVPIALAVVATAVVALGTRRYRSTTPT